MEHLHLKNKKLIIPLLVFVAVTCLVALVIYPVVSASPKGIELAALSLDEGAKTPQGEINIGDTLLDQIASATGEDSPISWVVLENEAELDEAAEKGTYYASLVIPKDFTATSVAAQMGTGEQSLPTITINQGKNPTIAATVETMFMQMMSETGISPNIKYLNPVSEDLGSGAIVQQMSYMLAIILTVILSIVLFVVIRTGFEATKKERIKSVGVQLIYAAVLSLGIGWFVSFFMTTIAQFAVPFAEILLFLWIVSFALMALFVGFFNLHPALGALSIVTVIVCGLTTALLPYELLPEFWQSWLYPWVPERFAADGLAQILYRGGDVLNSSAFVLLAIGAAGVILMLLSLLKPNHGFLKKQNQVQGEALAEE